MSTRHLNRPMTKRHLAARDIAQRTYADPSDNDIEIDDTPEFSDAADDGVWVSAWVYVRNDDIDESFLP